MEWEERGSGVETSFTRLKMNTLHHKNGSLFTLKVYNLEYYKVCMSVICSKSQNSDFQKFVFEIFCIDLTLKSHD